ncbi:cytochrome P450 20A1-like [Glandiceps talaboti]
MPNSEKKIGEFMLRRIWRAVNNHNTKVRTTHTDVDVHNDIDLSFKDGGVCGDCDCCTSCCHRSLLSEDSVLLCKGKLVPRKGNLPDIDEAGSFHEFLMKLHSKYGPVASFWYGKNYFVSLGSPEAFKYHIKLSDRPLELFEFVKPLVGPQSISFANGEDGFERRRVYDPPFRHRAIRNYYPIFEKAADGMVKKISSLPPEEHIGISEYISVYVIRATSSVAFGDFFDNDEKAATLLHHYETTFATLNQQIAVDKPKNENFAHALNEWHDLMRQAVQHRHDNPPGAQECSFIDVLIENCPTEERLLSDAVSYFVGSLHTTGYMMVWTFYYLTKHPQFQDKVYKEITDVLGEDGTVNNDILPELVFQEKGILRDLRKEFQIRFRGCLDFTCQVQEYLQFRDLFYGCIDPLCVVLFPARTLGCTAVVHALGVVSQDQKIWPNPDRFDPDRFSSKEASKRHPLAFSPFGFAGKRVCPGYRIAYAEATVFLVAVLRKFKFHLVEGQNIQRKYGFVTLPSDEVWLTVSNRN